ncbi:MAG: alanyl-tRNA editing protein [Anaerolineae bacterium]
MTDRLYYEDAYLCRFPGRVVETLDWDGRPAVVLDRTAFYPTGGGQPHDTGRLAGAAVIDVVERESDGAVVHILDGPLAAGDEVEGQVNWARRFDLMQQHTGQHLLSAAFVERLGANTVGFHLSDEYATIDLDRAPLSAEELAGVEDLTNQVIFENRPVEARFVPDEEVAHLPLRKPLAHEGPVRIVHVEGFDYSACGGTHVQATGELGLVKIVRSERRGAETRVEFLCGWRALADYGAKNRLLMDLARDFTVGHWEVAELVHRLADEAQDLRRELRTQRDALLDAEAAALWHEAGTVPRAGVRLVRADLPGRAPDDLKHLAQRLVTHPRTVALLAASAEPGQNGYLCFACSDDVSGGVSADVDLHMGQLVRGAAEAAGGRGGGRPNLAQGGSPQGERLAEALDHAYERVVDALSAAGG